MLVLLSLGSSVNESCQWRLSACNAPNIQGDVANYRDSGSTSIAPAPATPTDSTTCSNGFTGVERAGICCTLDCGTCGGSGCNRRAREAGLTSKDCCITAIEESGVLCEDSGTAPCIFGEGKNSSSVD